MTVRPPAATAIRVAEDVIGRSDRKKPAGRSLRAVDDDLSVAASEADASPASPGRVAIHRFRVTNTGAAEDLIRVKATTADGWTTTLGANVLDVPAGSTVTVPVYVTVPSDRRGLRSTTLTFTASSETDPGASVSRTSTVTPARGGGR